MCTIVRMKRIYLDTAAATPVSKAVFKRMKPHLLEDFGNPSSIHSEGVRAAAVLASARGSVAENLSVHSDEIIFTGGGTEANNLAISGVAAAYEESQGQTGHIITTTIEHHSVLDPIKRLAERGWSVSYLPVNEKGIIKPEELKQLLRSDTVLVSVGYVNNEIGIIAPLATLAKVIRNYRKQNDRSTNPYFHTDACQVPRFLELKPVSLGVDLMTLNGSKIYGPKGIGCLYRKRDVSLKPLVLGGGQESGLRSGTENVAGAVGLAEALKECERYRKRDNLHLGVLRDRLISTVSAEIPRAVLNGSDTERVSNNINFYFPDVEAELLVIELDARGIACSAGSACASNQQNDSHVITALEPTNTDRAKQSVRFTLGRTTKKRDIQYLLATLPTLVNKLRAVKKV